MSSDNLYLSVILVIAVILMAYFAWRLHSNDSSEKSTFWYTTPATPLVRAAAGELFATIKNMTTLGGSFEHQAQTTTLISADMRHGVAQLTKLLSRTEHALSSTPPTYANYLAIYKGLSGSDAAMLNAASAYENYGRQSQARGQGAHAKGAHDRASNIMAVGNTQIAMGAQMRRIVRAVHRLGAALDVE